MDTATLLGPPPMRHVAFCLGLIALAAAFSATPPAQAQKNEGMGVLGPVRIGGGGPRVDLNKPRRSTGRRAPRRGGCQPANPSGEAAIDRVICANRILLRKDERIALLFEILSKKTELDLQNQADILTRFYRELEEMHDFVHEIYPAG